MKSFNLFIYIFLIAITFSCGEEPSKKIKEVAKPKATIENTAKKETIKEEPKIDLISDENVKDKLLAYGKENPETVVDIYTSYGKVRVQLYKDTPLHRANFIMLAKKGFFEGSIFTRAVPHFIAQGGGTYNDKQVEVKKSIGSYTIPAEISKNHIHKRGAIGAARGYLNNPDKRSDPYAFYMVEGMKYPKDLLTHYEQKNNYTYSEKQIEYYTQNPGAAHIDGEHTVFGEIISGYDVVPKITIVETDSREWPRVDIYIDSVKVVR
ncbi:MAG: peptidylprolyl isomerase [Flavobacteriales bacterium]|nr:peptidylprolyl isomerase [Flavobacteriales bacterium]